MSGIMQSVDFGSKVNVAENARRNETEFKNSKMSEINDYFHETFMNWIC